MSKNKLHNLSAFVLIINTYKLLILQKFKFLNSIIEFHNNINIMVIKLTTITLRDITLVQPINLHFLTLIFKHHINQLVHKLTVFVQSLFMSRLACEASFLQYPLRGSIG